jgi:hypothetical protein
LTQSLTDLFEMESRPENPLEFMHARFGELIAKDKGASAAAAEAPTASAASAPATAAAPAAARTIAAPTGAESDGNPAGANEN